MLFVNEWTLFFAPEYSGIGLVATRLTGIFHAYCCFLSKSV